MFDRDTENSIFSYAFRAQSLHSSKRPQNGTPCSWQTSSSHPKDIPLHQRKRTQVARQCGLHPQTLAGSRGDNPRRVASTREQDCSIGICPRARDNSNSTLEEYPILALIEDTFFRTIINENCIVFVKGYRIIYVNK